MSNKIGLFALVAAMVALGVAYFHAPAASVSAKKETAFERVMRTRTLRCAYSIWPPFLMMDPNTKKPSGVDYEVMEAIGKTQGLKIEWQEEVGFGSYPDQLSSGKQDAFCVTVWNSSKRAQRVEYTIPEAYSPLYAYVRDGDTRFDNNLNVLNDEGVTIAVIDGSTGFFVASASFPKAKQYSLTNLSDASQLLMALASGKSDAAFYDEFTVGEYNRKNPDKKLRRVPGPEPVRVFGQVYSVAKGELELRDLLNVTLNELNGNGTIDKAIKKYESVPNMILRAAKPYQNPVASAP